MSIFHSLGRFSCRLGRPTESHNFIFGILREKVGGYLTPIAMVPVTGMVSWIQLEKQLKPMEADLEGLVEDPEKLIMELGGTGSTGSRHSMKVKNLVMVTKARAPYFLDPQLPW